LHFNTYFFCSFFLCIALGDGDLSFSPILVGKVHAVDRKFWCHFFAAWTVSARLMVC